MVSKSTRVTALIILLLASACASSRSRTMAEAQSSKNETTTARLRLEDFVTSFSNRIERASDLITQRTDDPSVKRNAVYYKLRVVPAARRSLDRADVQAVMMDLWLYSALVGQFSESAEGSQYFGEHVVLMAEAGADLRESARTVARSLMGAEQLELAEEGIVDYLSKHAVDADPEVEEKHKDDWANIVTRSLGKPLSVVTKPLSALNFTSGLSDTAVAVHQMVAEVDRTRTMLAYMPTDIRWQTQLLLLELEENLDLETVTASFAKVSDSSATLAETATTLPQDLRTELTTFVDAVDAKQANLQETLREVDTLIASTDATAKTLVETGDSLTKTFEAFDTMMVTLLGPPPDPDAPPPPPEDPDDKSEPFDITDYGDTAARVTETATALTALLAEAKMLEESNAAPALIEDTEAMARAVVNQVFLSGGLFVLFTAVVMLSYKLLAAKLRSRDRG